VSLYTLKSEIEPEMPTAAAAVLHYAALVHYAACDTDAHCYSCPVPLNPDGSPKGYMLPGMTGVAEMSGNDFMISLGERVQDISLSLTNDVTGISIVASVFMHELGHNLGIHHGGGIDTSCETDDDCPGAAEGSCIATVHGNLCLQSSEENYKVNYLSLMNYRFALAGIPYSATIGDPTPISFRLDYSTQILPTGGNTPFALDELPVPAHPGMDETAGLGSGTSDTFSFYDTTTCTTGGLGTMAATEGPVDLDGDGAATTTNVSGEISYYNDPPHWCGTSLRYLAGSKDWPTTWSGPDSVQFTYEFQCTPFYADGPSSYDAASPEPSIAELLEMHLADPVVPIRLDVRPGCANNQIDLWSGGEVELVAFGSFALDVTRIKTDEIFFAGAKPVDLSFADLDQDGQLDLTARFAIDALRLQPSSEMATLTAILDNEQMAFGADRIFVAEGEDPCVPCAGWSGGPKREGCWYVGDLNESCAEVCRERGGIDMSKWPHEGNPVCKIYFAEKKHAPNTAPIECCSATTAWGANGERPDPAFRSQECRLACACNR
jgi:hypothetical protein